MSTLMEFPATSTLNQPHSLKNRGYGAQKSVVCLDENDPKSRWILDEISRVRLNPNLDEEQAQAFRILLAQEAGKLLNESRIRARGRHLAATDPKNPDFWSGPAAWR